MLEVTVVVMMMVVVVAAQLQVRQVVLFAGVELHRYFIRVTEVGVRGELSVAPGRLFPPSRDRCERAARGRTHRLFDQGGKRGVVERGAERHPADVDR